MIYDIETLSIYNFFKISATGDLSYLHDDGKVSIESEDKWLEIVDKFNEITENTNHKNYLIDRIELISLTTRYDILCSCINSLIYIYDKDLINILVEMGYKFDENNAEASFDHLTTQSRVLLKKIQVKKNEFKRKYFDDKPEKNDFSPYIYVKEIAKKMKIQVDLKTTPTILFAYYIKDLRTWQTAE